MVPQTNFDRLKLQKPKSMVSQIYSSLSEAIINGSLKPGVQLLENDLQQEFGVSRAPIREAIRLLESDGLLIVDAYKKKYVRRITRDELQDSIPVLASVEGCAARLAATRFDDKQIEELKALTKEMKQAYQDSDIDACIDLNFRFHQAFAKVSNNKVLKRTLRSLIRTNIKLWVTTLYRQKPELVVATMKEHAKIIQTLVEREPRKTEEEVREHIEKVLDRAVKLAVFDDDGNYIF